MRKHVAMNWNNHTFTYNIDNKGKVYFHACCTMYGMDYANTENENDLFAKILAIPDIKTLAHTTLLPAHFPIRLWRYKRAVRLIENAVLNPNTIVGRRRLEREFDLIINDDL